MNAVKKISVPQIWKNLSDGENKTTNEHEETKTELKNSQKTLQIQ